MSEACLCRYRRKLRGTYTTECKAAGPLPAAWHRGDGFPRLATIANWVGEHTHLQAWTRPTSVSTDRKLRGTRLRHPGKGRAGTLLLIWHDDYQESTANRVVCRSTSLIQHNSAETYRFNGEVVSALHELLTDHPEYLKK